MKLLEGLLGSIVMMIFIAVILNIISSGIEQSPIHIGIWVIATVVAMFLWKKSPKNTKAREFALAAMFSPLTIVLGGPVVLAIDPTVSTKTVSFLHFGYLGLTAIFLLVSFWWYRAENRMAHCAR